MAHPHLALRPTGNGPVSHYIVAGSKNPLPLGMGSVNALASAVIPNGHNDQKNVQKDDRKENETEQRILDMIAAKQDISVSVMADQMGISYKTVQRAINHLKETGRIRRSGGKRFGYWEIIEKQ